MNQFKSTIKLPEKPVIQKRKVTIESVPICAPFLVEDSAGVLSVVIVPYADYEQRVVFFDLEDNKIRHGSPDYLVSEFYHANPLDHGEITLTFTV